VPLLPSSGASSIVEATAGFAETGTVMGMRGWVCCIFTVALGSTGF
jgi:hypothetical protein